MKGNGAKKDSLFSYKLTKESWLPPPMCLFHNANNFTIFFYNFTHQQPNKNIATNPIETTNKFTLFTH